MDFRGGVGVSRLSSSHELEIEFISSEQLGVGDFPGTVDAATPFVSLCFFFRFFFRGFPAELTMALVNIDRLYVFLIGVRDEDRVRTMAVVVGQASFSIQTTGLQDMRWRVVF